MWGWSKETKSTYGDGLVVCGDLRERGIFAHHSDGNLWDGSGAGSTVAGVARPPRVVFSSRWHERWSPTADAARPPRIVVSRRRLRGSLRVARIRCCSLHREVCVVATASQRRVLHDGGLLGVVVSASFVFCQFWVPPKVSTTTWVWDVSGCRGSACSVQLASMSQSDQTELFSFFSWLWPLRDIILYFSAILIETHSSSVVRSKKLLKSTGSNLWNVIFFEKWNVIVYLLILVSQLNTMGIVLISNICFCHVLNPKKWVMYLYL